MRGEGCGCVTVVPEEDLQPPDFGFGISGFGFGVWGLVLEVSGFGLGVLSLAFWVSGFGFGDQGSGIRDCGSGLTRKAPECCSTLNMATDECTTAVKKIETNKRVSEDCGRIEPLT